MQFRLVAYALLVLAATSSSEDESGSCAAKNKNAGLASNLVSRVNKLDMLVEQDKEREGLFFLPLPEDPVQLRNHFYRVTSQPLQTVCGVSKLIGGEWATLLGANDGVKFVCMDRLLRDIETGNCLVYSFGIAEDWSFEDAMGALGCKVRAFDPSIDAEENRSANVSFRKVGLGHKSGQMAINTPVDVNQMMVPVVTLDDAVAMFGDEGKEISYLKVDVEGSEMKALPLWAKAGDKGALANVRQLGIEMHTRSVKAATDEIRSLLKAFASMQRMGFRLVSYMPNLCLGKVRDPAKTYYTFFDLVFYRI